MPPKHFVIISYIFLKYKSLMVFFSKLSEGKYIYYLVCNYTKYRFSVTVEAQSGWAASPHPYSRKRKASRFLDSLSGTDVPYLSVYWHEHSITSLAFCQDLTAKNFLPNLSGTGAPLLRGAGGSVLLKKSQLSSRWRRKYARAKKAVRSVAFRPKRRRA